MNFNSYTFILIFLPIMMIMYYLVGRLKNIYFNLALITLTSIFFYWSSEQILVLFLAGTIIFNYCMYLLLKINHSKLVLMVGIIINVSILGVCKYFNFAIDCTNMVFKTNLQIRELFIPLGISFITFQQIAFLVDTYKNVDLKCGILEYVTFVSFFPHISSGPIITQGQFLPEIRKEIFKVNWDNISEGLFMFAVGFAKKVLLADVYGNAVNTGYSNIEQLNVLSTVFITLAYTLQIYFDFSGYCDMALGIAKLLNINLPINFNSPYKAVTIIDFWERWHITLTKFLTKYLYIPLGGNRKGTLRTMLNTMVIFVISGLWHGASLTFIAWGISHGLFMIITKLFIKQISRIPKIINQMITFIFVNFTWILFRASSFRTFIHIVKKTFVKGTSLGADIASCFADLNIFTNNFIPEELAAWMFLIFGLILVFVLKNTQELIDDSKWKISSAILTVFLLLLSIFSLTGTTTYIYTMF